MSTKTSTQSLPAAQASVLAPIDRHFAALMGRLSHDEPELKLAAALVSYYRRQGHIYLDLEAFDREGPLEKVPGEFGSPAFPPPSSWVKRLKASPAVGKPGDFTPLVLDDHGRLYLLRYWEYETELAQAILRRAKETAPAVDGKTLKEALARLFPQEPGGEVDWQMAAAFAASRRRLCIISGGPGTGKTRTAVVLLALLLEQNPSARVALAAPTGKAAARLQEAVKNAKAGLPCAQQTKDRLPEEASTIHRLLGSIPDSAYFRHDAGNPLPFDVVVVDEVSMVDLALMAKLVAAVPPSARLILLGDKDQLASVEAGAVLADLCNTGEQLKFSKEFIGRYAGVTGQTLSADSASTGSGDLADCIVELRKNYRFGQESGIYELSQAVNDGDADRAIDVLQKASGAAGSQAVWKILPEPSALKAALKATVLDNYTPYLKAAGPAEAMQRFGHFRILCALRGGPYGVENLNRLVEQILAEAGLVDPSATFYAGRPVLITRNDYNLRLFNGDIGVLLPDTQKGLRAFFAGPEQAVRDFLPLRLPEHETAYAMTVHKSQGSEFERVLLILPPAESPVVTRELVYTGLTRASNHVELWGREPALRGAIAKRINRSSGLRDALWGKAGTAS
jgi:exodeoxyribonuclease V alpha subunit